MLSIIMQNTEHLKAKFDDTRPLLDERKLRLLASGLSRRRKNKKGGIRW